MAGSSQGFDRVKQPRSHIAMSPLHPRNAVLLRVKVKPNARRSELIQEADGTWRAQLKAPPVDGRANEELIALIATHFKCRKADVTIKSGASGRIKLVRVETPTGS